MSPCGPTLPTWALQEVGSYIRAAAAVELTQSGRQPVTRSRCSVGSYKTSL
jgi:hypothetical protein